MKLSSETGNNAVTNKDVRMDDKNHGDTPSRRYLERKVSHVHDLLIIKMTWTP